MVMEHQDSWSLGSIPNKTSAFRAFYSDSLASRVRLAFRGLYPQRQKLYKRRTGNDIRKKKPSEPSSLFVVTGLCSLRDLLFKDFVSSPDLRSLSEANRSVSLTLRVLRTLCALTSLDYQHKPHFLSANVSYGAMHSRQIWEVNQHNISTIKRANQHKQHNNSDPISTVSTIIYHLIVRK